MNLIGRLFKSPDAYRFDPRGFAINQALHFSLIGYLPIYFDLWWLPLSALLLGFAIWEFLQWCLVDGDLSDGFEDWTFVAMGGLAVSAPQMILPALALLVSGYLFRKGF